jgi:cysteine dioxygenase
MNFAEKVRLVLEGLKSPSHREMREAILSLECTPESVAPYVTDPKEYPYGRNVIYRDDEVEAVLIHMPGWMHSSVHDHGLSTGSAYVVEGQLVNTLYRLTDSGKPVPYAESIVEEGGFYNTMKHQIHAISNPKKDRFVTFHIYTPPMSGMQIYEAAYNAAEEYLFHI